VSSKTWEEKSRWKRADYAAISHVTHVFWKLRGQKNKEEGGGDAQKKTEMFS
jgi:hypothetical protein